MIFTTCMNHLTTLYAFLLSSNQHHSFRFIRPSHAHTIHFLFTHTISCILHAVAQTCVPHLSPFLFIQNIYPSSPHHSRFFQISTSTPSSSFPPALYIPPQLHGFVSRFTSHPYTIFHFLRARTYIYLVPLHPARYALHPLDTCNILNSSPCTPLRLMHMYVSRTPPRHVVPHLLLLLQASVLYFWAVVVSVFLRSTPNLILNFRH